MQDTTSRLALRRAFRGENQQTVTDFECTTQRFSVARPALVALVISGVGLLGFGGVAITAAATSTQQAENSFLIDREAADVRKAAPMNVELDANQQATQADSRQTGSDNGGLKPFGQRGTTPNRNGVRSALNTQLSTTRETKREVTLSATNKSVTNAQAAAEAEERERLMNDDVAKVKAEEKRIREEKRKAAELLKKLKAEAAARKAAEKKASAGGETPSDTGSETPVSGGQNPTKDEPVSVDGKDYNISSKDLQAISNGSVAAPLAPGSYSLGAYFGKTGSWARYHTGQDFPAATGTPVYAAAAGVVGGDMSAAGWAGSYYVTIHHAGGDSTLYAHLSARVVSAGEPVKAGQLIGYVGNEGRSFGAHLHFEYYPAGTTPGDVYSAGDPMAWLRGHGLPI